jgi:hypothetical protein
MKDILWAPALNNASEEYLFWIISDIWAKTIYCLSVQPIGTFDYFWY